MTKNLLFYIQTLTIKTRPHFRRFVIYDSKQDVTKIVPLIKRQEEDGK